MQQSSVSDFEHFALKVEKHIAAKVKKSKESAELYQVQKNQEAEDETERWLKQKHSEWEAELKAQEQQGKRAIADEVGQRWSAFIKESEAALGKAFELQLQDQFPSLVKCFVTWISKHYKTGIFILPNNYSAWIDKERFGVELSQEEKIIFRSDNLYIEYSVEQIIEELKEEINATIHLKESSWAV